MKLTVKIASYAVRQPFVVVRQLQADALLDCTYTEKHVEQVRLRMKFIQLANGVRVPIRRRAQAIPLDRPTKETHCVTPAPALTHSAKVCVARRTRVPAGTEAAIQVSARVSGTHVLSPIPNLYFRERVSVANGLVDIMPMVRFRITVVNFAENDVTLH